MIDLMVKEEERKEKIMDLTPPTNKNLTINY